MPSTRDRRSDDATRVVVSYPSGGTSDGAGRTLREALDAESYRRYLRVAHAGEVSPGETWREFVNRGCGRRAPVVLRVERVDGGATVGDETRIEFVPRDHPDDRASTE